jgi:hypothetical protein
MIEIISGATAGGGAVQGNPDAIQVRGRGTSRLSRATRAKDEQLLSDFVVQKFSRFRPLIIGLAFLVACSPEFDCVVADEVRVLIDGTGYRIPAALQPFYSPSDAIKTRDYFPEGLRTKQYCQPAEAAPPAVRSFAFRGSELSAWAAKNPRFSRLGGIDPLEINAGPAAPSRILVGGEITRDGLFRRLDHQGWYELLSMRPLLFGAPIFANCSLAGTQKPSERCRISGRMPMGSLIYIDVLDTTHPRETWPEMLAEVEQFIVSLMRGETRNTN